MTLSKTKLGISIFDTTFGGIYLRQPTLIRGKRKSGRTVVCAHFINKTLSTGDNVLLITDRRPEDILLDAEAINIDFTQAIEENQLKIISYRDMPSAQQGYDPYAPIPYEQAYEELKKLVIAHHIHFIIFDSVVPWLAVTPVEKMPAHVEKFFEDLQKLVVTTLLILPYPLSKEAIALSEKLEELCHITIDMYKGTASEFFMSVKKYQGNKTATLPMDIQLELIPGKGFITFGERQTENINTTNPGDEELVRHTYRPYLEQTFTNVRKTFNGYLD